LYEGREFQTGKPDITIILKRVDDVLWYTGASPHITLNSEKRF